MGFNPNAGTQMYYIRQSDGLAYCFSPVPLITDSKEFLHTVKDGVDVRLGTRNRLTFNGVLLPDLPALSGVDDYATCLELLDRKSDQLRDALNEDRGNLLIVDASGYPMLSVYPKITSFDFPESQMTRRRDYTIAFEYDSDFNDECKIDTYSESWDFASQDDDTISVSHTINAVGLPDMPAATGALENAKAFVLPRVNVLDKSKSSFLTTPYVSSLVDVQNLTEYNHTRSESVDDVQGSYQISESWTMASGAYKDDRTVEINTVLDEFGTLVDTITMNGTVVGYGDITFDKLDNAVYGFENVVAPEIGFYSTTNVASRTRSDNRFGGSVSYSIAFGTDVDEPLESRTTSRSFQRNEDGTTSQTVTVSAKVKPTSESGIELAMDYVYANNYPIDNAVEPYFAAALSGNLESISSERDEIQKIFTLTKIYREQGVPNYREEYQVNREQSVQNAITTITVNGTIYGLSSEDSTSSQVRFHAASGAFYGTVEPLILSRAWGLVPSGGCIGSSQISDTIGFNKINGIITYDYKFDNKFKTDNENILDENLDVQYTLPGDVVVKIPIPGKADGPILQDQETTTGYSKTLKIQYTMRASGNTCGQLSTTEQRNLEIAALAESDILVNHTLSQNSRGEKPEASHVFKVSDNYTFGRQSYIFTRSTAWDYTAT